MIMKLKGDAPYVRPCEDFPYLFRRHKVSLHTSPEPRLVEIHLPERKSTVLSSAGYLYPLCYPVQNEIIQSPVFCRKEKSQ